MSSTTTRIVAACAILLTGIAGCGYRYREAEPAVTIPKLQRQFDCKFPTNTLSLKVAAMRVREADVMIARLQAATNDVRQFMESFSPKLYFAPSLRPWGDSPEAACSSLQWWDPYHVSKGQVGIFKPPGKPASLLIMIDDVSSNGYSTIYFKANFQAGD